MLSKQDTLGAAVMLLLVPEVDSVAEMDPALDSPLDDTLDSVLGAEVDAELGAELGVKLDPLLAPDSTLELDLAELLVDALVDNLSVLGGSCLLYPPATGLKLDTGSATTHCESIGRKTRSKARE